MKKYQKNITVLKGFAEQDIRSVLMKLYKEYCGAKPSRLEATTTPTEEELKERLENKELEHFVLMKHVSVVPDMEKSKTTEKDYKSFLEATVEEIKSKATQIKLEQDNITSFAELNWYTINWETGKVTEKS